MKDTDFLVSPAGVRMPPIIYGTAWKKDRTADLVEQALVLGFRGLDTACQPKHYNEAGVGEGLARCLTGALKREDIYLQSKFTPQDGQDPNRIPYDPRARVADQVGQSFAASLNNLKTAYLDCLVLHSPYPTETRTMEAWSAMEAIFDAGGARQLGISNCYDPSKLDSLYCRSRVKPSVIQNRFYAVTGYDRKIREFCRERQIVYQSFWTLTANPDILADPAVQALASKYGRTPAQVFFRYLTRIGVVPLTGTTSAAHMKEDLAMLDLELTTGEIDALDTLLRN